MACAMNIRASAGLRCSRGFSVIQPPRCWRRRVPRQAAVSNPLPSDFDEEHLASVDIHLPELSQAEHVKIVQDFLPCANDLRETFDEKFENPRKVHMERFCWDYWHIPGQYTQLRTPAQDFFDKVDFQALEAGLMDYGKEFLGCTGITPIWLSYYVDGCKQELHCDNPHGPWAFVLSLTDWDSRKFTGGETVMLSDFVLSFWSNFAIDTVVEGEQLLKVIEPRFNQLTVFDPRIPHGVREVRGVQEPTKARIVLHGWFTEPEMFLEGALTYAEAEEAMNSCMAKLTEHISELPEATGTLVIRITVSASGSVKETQYLTDTLVARPWDVRENDVGGARANIHIAVQKAFSEYHYPEADGETVITMPLIFE